MNAAVLALPSCMAIVRLKLYILCLIVSLADVELGEVCACLTIDAISIVVSSNVSNERSQMWACIMICCGSGIIYIYIQGGLYQAEAARARSVRNVAPKFIV